jgi:large subunit ribosomal protein L24
MGIVRQHKFKLKKEDIVQVITGKDKGKRGRILKILHSKDRVFVEGINIIKKAKKRRSQQERGGILEIEAPIHRSNLMIICKKCGITRIGYKIDGDIKIRVCRKCGEIL